MDRFNMTIKDIIGKSRDEVLNEDVLDRQMEALVNHLCRLLERIFSHGLVGEYCSYLGFNGY
jgi:hypothetical protein